MGGDSPVGVAAAVHPGPPGYLAGVTRPPPGVYDQLVTLALARALDGTEDARTEDLSTTRTANVLAWHVYERVRAVLSDLKGDDASAQAIDTANRVLAALPRPDTGDAVAQPARLLTSVLHADAPAGSEPEAPLVPLREGALLVNGPRDINMLRALRNELATADRVDLIVAFLRFSGVRLLVPTLQEFFRRGGRMRLATTIYTGATELRAVKTLAGLGAEVRVSYETHGTRLHAKAWLFERDSGFSTGLVGSSNLSHAALVDGLEWNVRLGALENAALLDRFRATFAQYWDDRSFEAFVPGEDDQRLGQALAAQRGGAPDGEWVLRQSAVPRMHQQVLLERLSAERSLGHHRNLIVAATGTGKTWVAAFDYAQATKRSGSPPRLLFVAHRKEILEQARQAFRGVLQDRQFGELLVDGELPLRWEHVFASIQSLSAERLSALGPEHFAIVIVDEFHHAAADSYARLLDHFKPGELLGLTATPERADGEDILRWFDGRVAGELRLWDALEQGLLVPFHYFGVHDGTSLAGLRWQRGGYDLAELQAVYNGNTRRAELVLQTVRDYITDPTRMRALGFCVSVVHARFMAGVFNQEGLASVALVGDTPADERREAVARLERGELVALFTVDLFNEGVDIPRVDTVLFLRPTESLTLFLQQLGRGLRLAPEKALLTVLDFIGDAHRSFRFDLRMRALSNTESSREALRHVQRDFPSLPPACSVQLEREAREVVLRNIRTQLADRSRNRLLSELRRMGGSTTLAQFLAATELSPQELYTHKPGASWTGLRRAAGFEARLEHPSEGRWDKAFARLLHIDDSQRLDALATALQTKPAPGPMARLVHTLLGERTQPLAENARNLAELVAHPPARDELAALVDVLRDRLHSLSDALPDSPLRVHATYTRSEVLAAMGVLSGEGEAARLREFREGVLWVAAARVDLLFVTLDKSASSFTETTRYEDYPLTPRLFHWQSQSETRADDPTGRRYQEHVARGSRVWLFVRERPKDERGLGTPYQFLGPARYVSHVGERPMSITWELEVPMPAATFARAKVAAG